MRTASSSVHWSVFTINLAPSSPLGKREARCQNCLHQIGLWDFLVVGARAMPRHRAWAMPKSLLAQQARVKKRYSAMVSTSVPAQPSPDDGVQPRNVSHLSPLLPKLLSVTVLIKVIKKLPKHLVTMSSPKALSGGSPNLTGRVPTKTFLSFQGCTHPPSPVPFLISLS